MPEQKRLAVAVLAAGASRRFGEADKLSAEFRGEKLGLHAARAIPRHLFQNAWVICAQTEHPCAAEWRAMGFDIRANPKANEGMGTSVALAASLAAFTKADALMIVLADMPFVPESHLEKLVKRALADGPDHIGTSANKDACLPPAIFGSDHFARLAQLAVDKGAREILSRGAVVECPPDWLRDIDTSGGLAALA
ncbi:NTP transferase domain-containing protein [Erythrobacter sp. F6033]|uniref:NTP transferase domain-containing protein n=1 Tax=Erythrobacter sp. F6033 TaxID=2926401 RepID=UPI001FF5A5BA|nr:NTP transferase domain-containing protein [Erythrobacter sp. F6033]